MNTLRPLIIRPAFVFGRHPPLFVVKNSVRWEAGCSFPEEVELWLSSRLLVRATRIS